MPTTTPKGHERRYFPRVEYRGYASLVTPSKKWPVHIIDLSFNGALVAIIHEHTISDGEEIILSIEADDAETIKMQGRVVHHKEHFLGIDCRASSIDHQSRLEKLVQEHAPADMERTLKHMLDEHHHP